MKNSKLKKTAVLLFVLALLAWPAARTQAKAPKPGEGFCKHIQVVKTVHFVPLGAKEFPSNRIRYHAAYCYIAAWVTLACLDYGYFSTKAACEADQGGDCRCTPVYD